MGPKPVGRIHGSREHGRSGAQHVNRRVRRHRARPLMASAIDDRDRDAVVGQTRPRSLGNRRPCRQSRPTGAAVDATEQRESLLQRPARRKTRRAMKTLPTGDRKIAVRAPVNRRHRYGGQDRAIDQQHRLSSQPDQCHTPGSQHRRQEDDQQNRPGAARTLWSQRLGGENSLTHLNRKSHPRANGIATIGAPPGADRSLDPGEPPSKLSSATSARCSSDWAGCSRRPAPHDEPGPGSHRSRLRTLHPRSAHRGTRRPRDGGDPFDANGNEADNNRATSAPTPTQRFEPNVDATVYWVTDRRFRRH